MVLVQIVEIDPTRDYVVVEAEGKRKRVNASLFYNCWEPPQSRKEFFGSGGGFSGWKQEGEQDYSQPGWG